jgi:hypothetical protein
MRAYAAPEREFGAVELTAVVASWVVAGPEAGGASTSQGHPYAVFQRALQRRNVLMAVATATQLPQLGLLDAS